MAEASDRPAENRELTKEETFEEFRREVKEHTPDGLGGRDLGGKEAAESAEETAKPGESGQDQAADTSYHAAAPKHEGESGEASPPAEDDSETLGQSPELGRPSANDETKENCGQPLTDDEIGPMRREIQEEFGPDGLGKAPGGENPEKEVSERYQGHLLEEEFADGADSLNQSGNQVVVTELKQGPEEPGKMLDAIQVETSDLRRLQPDPEGSEQAETRTLEAVDYGKGAVVRVPKTDLEREGFEPEKGENAIVRLELQDVDNDDVDVVFARYNASDRRAEAYVGEIGGEKGSRYELVEAREVNEDMLVRDFERGKCEHLQNVKLEHGDEKTFLNVDSRRVELEDYHISTGGAHAVIRGRLDGEDSCKIEFDGRRASVMFGRDYPVEGMEMTDDVLTVRYAQSRNEKHEKQLHLEHLENPERPSLNQFGREEMLDHVKVFDRPEGVSGLFQFVMDEESQNEIKRLLDDADERGRKQYGATKAEIGETLVPNLLETCGWTRIERHPFGTKEKDSASSNGTDWLMQTPDGEVVLMEVKWHRNKRDAIRRASTQVERDFLEHRSDPDLKLEGAYIGIMDYDEGNSKDEPVRIHVLRVRPAEDLR